jgi:glycosyltransferase involved in cell wall biosynthesis
MSTPRILFIPWENSGVGLCRIMIPAMSLANNKLAEVETGARFTGDGENIAVDVEHAVKDINGRKHQILYTTKPLSTQQLAFCNTMQHYGYKWVLDMDDNILDVNSDNPGYGAFNKMGSGDNRFFIEIGMRDCDLLVVSTENLAELYKKYNKKIFINPNSIDFRFWKFDNAWGKTNKTVIGWAGAGGHTYDMSIIEDVAKELKEKYGKKIEFVSFGGEEPKFFDKHVNWVDLKDYPEKLASLGFDIGIAPLRDNLYNRGKSNLRWLEYSALKIPTVASDVHPYRDTNALLCVTHDDWIQALSTLIDDKNIRQALGEKAHEIVQKNFNAETSYNPLAKRLEELVWKKPLKSKSGLTLPSSARHNI